MVIEDDCFPSYLAKFKIGSMLTPKFISIGFVIVLDLFVPW